MTAHTRASDVPAGDLQVIIAPWRRLARHGSRRQPVAAVLLVPQAPVAAEVQLARCSGSCSELSVVVQEKLHLMELD